MAHERDPLGRLRQRVYTVLLLAGLVGSASAWLTNELVGAVSPFTRGIFIVTLVFAASQTWLLRSGRASVRLVEESIYVFFSTILLCVLFYALYPDPPPPLAQVSLVSLFLWFPFVYVFVFLAYESRGALLRSGLLYLLAVCVSLPHALSTQSPEDPFEGFSLFGQFYVSTASIVLVLFFLTEIKDQLRETQDVAERMRMLASTDALTGILNRRQVELLLDEEVERASRYGLPLSLIVFDLDDFKQVNDAYGHDVGDSVLVEVARLIELHLRASDGFGRWGGEEFVVVAVETPVEPVRQLANRIRAAIEGHDFGELAWQLSASFGVATHHRDNERSTLVKRADVALYRAKGRGKNRVEVQGRTDFLASFERDRS